MASSSAHPALPIPPSPCGQVFADRLGLMRLMRLQFFTPQCRRESSLLDFLYPHDAHTDPFKDTPQVLNDASMRS